MSGATPTNGVASNGIGVVSDSQLNAFAQVDPNISRLRSFVGISGMGVVLFGLTAAGDGNAGLYYWADGTNFVDNGNTVIVPDAAAGQGAWLLAPLNPAGGGAFLPLAGGTVTGPTTFEDTLKFTGLPTSDAGLLSGDVFLNGEFVCVKS